jgi:Ca2+-dependent lipid-binding protein
VQMRLGKQKHTTKVIPKTLSPSWHVEFVFQITPNLLESNLLLTVWDKDLFKSQFMGVVEFPLAELIQTDFENIDNHPEWYPLNARNPKEIVSGDICLQFGYHFLLLYES